MLNFSHLLISQPQSSFFPVDTTVSWQGSHFGVASRNAQSEMGDVVVVVVVLAAVIINVIGVVIVVLVVVIVD